MDKLYIYKSDIPCGIIDNIDRLTIGQIDSIYEIMRIQGKECYLKPIHPYDFVFDPETGEKMWAKIETFNYPDFDPGKEV